MDQIEEVEGSVELSELESTRNNMRTKIRDVENELEKANRIIKDHKTHIIEANEKIKDMGKDLDNANERLGTTQNKLKEAEVALAKADAKWRLEMTQEEAKWKLEMNRERGNWEAAMIQAKQTFEAELTREKENSEAAMIQAKQTCDAELTREKGNSEAAMTQAKQTWDAEMTREKGNWETDKERLEKALEKMDVSLAAKNMDGLSWLLFSVKFTLEATLAGLEFGANKNSGMKFLIACILIAFLALMLNGWEVVRTCREKKVRVNHKIIWSRVPWLPEIYSFMIILLELGFYVLKLWILHPVHVSPYTCILHTCILVQKLISRQKAARARRVVV